MKMLMGVLVALGVIVVAFLGYVAMQPNTFHVERSMTIAAPDSVVFEQINDFRNWAAWSPWEDVDPDMEKSIEGPPTGVGASYHWAGNDQAGEGRMTITESIPHSQVTIRLEFMKPWASTNTIAFAIGPRDGQTHVTWSMDGNHIFMSKVIGVFVNMDKMIGTDFEKGLGRMKEVAEFAGEADGETEPTAS